MPPSSTVPPSGTLTVVTTETNENDGNCTVTPCAIDVPLLRIFLVVFAVVVLELLVLLELVLDDEPSNVNVSTLPICVKNGTMVIRT